MRTQLIQAGFEVDEEQGGLYHPDISLDVVGIITTTIGDTESVEYVTEPGYHVNLRVINDDLDLSSWMASLCPRKHLLASGPDYG
jgi:hypothetical protein